MMKNNQHSTRLAMFWNRVGRRILAWALCSAAILGTASSSAQDIAIDGWKVVFNRPFHAADGSEMFTGNFVGMVDGRVHLVSPSGEEKKLRLEEFSEEDRNWIRNEISAQKQRDTDKEKVIKIRTQLSIGNSNTIISNCKKLRSIGRNAELVSDELNRLVTNHPDELVKMEAFITYVAVSREDAGTVEWILNALTNQWSSVMGKLEKKPEEFLEEMAGFRGLALPYLQHVAAVGLLTPPKTNEPFTRTIQEFSPKDSASWRARNAALAAIGKVGGEESLLLVLDHLTASSEVEKRERAHQANIEACLNAIGAIGIDNEDVQAALDRHATDFPKVVDRVRGLLNK